MSNPFGLGSTTFAIHTDGAENQGNPALRKTKAGEMQGKPPATKRAALGVITNQTRVQPLRSAKQGTSEPFGHFSQNENVQPKAAKTVFSTQPSIHQPFGIHTDSENIENKPVSIQPKLQIRNAGATRSVLSSIEPFSIHEDSPTNKESPMLLDTSMDLHRVEETPEQRLDKILTVPEYTDEIYEFLRQSEGKFKPKVGYMKKQPDITHSMRSILVDWLVEVAEEYKLHRETLFLAVNYIDRFLSQMSVLRGRLQLVGAASMFLAAKYEEIYPPDVKEFVYITDDTYTQEQVLKMETLILKVLSFDVAAPTINIFAERFLKLLGFSDQDKAYNLAMYLIELSMLDAETYHRFQASEIAASAVCLACHTLGLEAWPSSMALSTGYSMQQLMECVQNLYATFIRSPTNPQTAIREKYKQSKLKQVSGICPPETLPFQLASPSEMIS